MNEKTLDIFSSLAEKIISRNNIRCIFELGARDCRETLAFHEWFPQAEIYTFECNPDTLPVCREKTAGIEKIHLVEKAVSDKDGILTFYKIDRENTQTTFSDGNPGASSLLQANPEYPVEHYIQKPIEVQTTTLKTFFAENNIENVDMLWMDIQGAELLALDGAGADLSKIKMIHAEVEFFEMYKGQPLYREVVRYMNERGFRLLRFTNFGKYFGDAIFINKTIKTGFIWPERLVYFFNLVGEKISGKWRGAKLKLEKYAAARR